MARKAKKPVVKKVVKKPVKISWFKKTFNAVKGWIVGNGIDRDFRINRRVSTLVFWV